MRGGGAGWPGINLGGSFGILRGAGILRLFFPTGSLGIGAKPGRFAYVLLKGLGAMFWGIGIGA